MDVINMIIKIVLIPDEMFPEATLPGINFTFLLAGCHIAFFSGIPIM